MADAEERLYQDLEWLGLSWDEGEFRLILPNARDLCSCSQQAPTKTVLMALIDRYVLLTTPAKTLLD